MFNIFNLVRSDAENVRASKNTHSNSTNKFSSSVLNVLSLLVIGFST